MGGGMCEEYGVDSNPLLKVFWASLFSFFFIENTKLGLWVRYCYKVYYVNFPRINMEWFQSLETSLNCLRVTLTENVLWFLNLPKNAHYGHISTAKFGPFCLKTKKLKKNITLRASGHILWQLDTFSWTLLGGGGGGARRAPGYTCSEW